MAIEITDKNFTEMLNSGLPLVVDLWAEWCGPCRMLTPTIEELATDYEGRVNIGKLNVDENVDVPATYKVRNIPTILFFKGGELVDKHVGVATKEALAKKIDELL